MTESWVKVKALQIILYEVAGEPGSTAAAFDAIGAVEASLRGCVFFLLSLCPWACLRPFT